MKKKERKLKVKKSPKETYEFLLDIENYFTVLPENIETFHIVDEDTFVMGLKKIPPISFTVEGTIENKQVVYKTESYINVTIIMDIEQDEKFTDITMTVDMSQVSPFLKFFMPHQISKFGRELRKQLNKMK